MKEHYNGIKTPVYLQIYEELKAEISNGVFPYGTKLPSKRTLSDRFSVSLITIEHSLELLLDEGYLESRERSGYFVSFNESDMYSSPALRHTEISPVSSTVKRDFPFSVYARTMRKVLTEQGDEILQRSPGTGIGVFKQSICDYLARSRGFHVSPEQIIIGAGSEYLYSLIVQLLGSECQYAIEKPSYKKIEMVYRANGVVPTLLPLGEDGILSSSLASCHAHVLHITPYRSFPSGISTTASKRREYIRWAHQNHSILVEDDYESEFTPSSKPEETVFSLAADNNVIYLNSFTQTIAPSVRISYMILPPSLITLYQEKLGFYACTVPTFEQYVMAEFISSGEFERHINRVRRKKRKRAEQN